MTVDLIIAGRRIRLRSGEGITLRPDERFSDFIASARAETAAEEKETGGGGPDLAEDPESGIKEAGAGGHRVSSEPVLTVDVFAGKAAIPHDAVKVFDARLMEETPDGPRDSGEPFWEILTGEGVTWAKVFLKEPACNPVIAMPHGQMIWQIYADLEGSKTDPDLAASGGKQTQMVFSDSAGNKTRQVFTDKGVNAKNKFPVGGESKTVNPLPYPVDGLLLWFLSSAMGDIMIHGSGVVCGGRGWIFTGRSGSGKTTMAGIFDRAGDRVIHDDRLILRREANGWVMHSTPVYRNDEPRSAAIDHLWAISHGTSNISMPVTGAGAVAMVLSNCIQQNWNRAAAVRLAASVEELVAAVRISSLTFLPDRSIRDYLAARESDDFVTAAGAASAILAEEKTVTITAGGYSMWPAIRPGDRVAIGPLKELVPVKGDIVALRRDGGYVVHRVRRVTVRGSRQLYHTQGDAVLRSDTPSDMTAIAGIVKKISRADREIDPPPRRLPAFIGYAASLIVSHFRRKR